MKPAYQYRAEVVRVVDGDTIDVILDFGFSLKQKMRLRLAYVDTPELRSKDEDERDRAQAAKQFVMEKLFRSDGDPDNPRPAPLVVKTLKTRAGKERQTFGRYVAEVYYQEVDSTVWTHLNEALVVEGHAERSSG
jgi:micrococcal nuclease